MKNRPKPGTKSYAATGGDLVQHSNSPMDGHSSEKTEAQGSTELDSAIAENTKLKEKVRILEKENETCKAQILQQSKPKGNNTK